MKTKTPPKKKPRNRPVRPTITPELLNTVQAARFCGRSISQWYIDIEVGTVPAAAVKINGRPRWRMSELVAWIDAGCPKRAKWESIKAQGK